MVRTPWGDASELRSKKLNPGQSTPRDEVILNQRERLFGAMVATVAEKGYEATAVADLVKLSGVSRRTFYEQFRDKEDCFAATVEALLEAGLTFAVHGLKNDGDNSWGGQTRRMLEAFLQLVAAQPAAARFCLVDSYAAGEAVLARLAQTVDEIERQTLSALETLPGHGGTPPALARAVIGGLYRVLYRHLHRGTEQELVPQVDELWRWAMSYTPPPRPLRARTRRTERAPATPPFAAHIPSERVLRGFASAVAERGYAAVTIADIAAHARISQATFYAHFKDMEDALLAALDSSGAQLVAATLPAVRRSDGGAAAVRTALDAAFSFLAAEPAFARLRTVEVLAAGPRAVEQCNKIEEEISAMIVAQRPPGAPELSPLAIEATLGAINSLLFEHVRNEGSESLATAVPLATYIALTPFVGAEKACAVANGE